MKQLMAADVIRKRVRVLYLQPAPLFGGAERQAALTTALMPQFDVDVVPMVGPGRVISDWLRERGVMDMVETRHFPGGWKKQRGLWRMTLPYRYVQCGIRAREQIEHLVRTRSIDVILSSLPFAWITGSLVARSANIPIVWRAGGTYLNIAQQTALWLLTRVQRPDLLLCNGEAVRAVFSPLIPAPVRVVRNGVDHTTFHPHAGDPSRYRPSGAKYVVGCAMRLAASKRPSDFIELAARLKHVHPHVHFLLAGEGSQRAAFERMARERGADNARLLGFVSDMPSFYAACDLLVLPSRSEGCSNFMLEALAMGKPMVAADIPPVVELARASRNVVTFELGNVAELARAVSGLLAHPSRLAELGAQARLSAGRFTARASAAQIAALLKGLVAERARATVPQLPAHLLPDEPPSGEQKTAAE